MVTDPIARLESLRSIDDHRVRDQQIEQIAVRLHEAGQSPEWEVWTADFDRDVFLICADRYWRLRFLNNPVVETAAACGRWLSRFVDETAQTAVFQKWTKGYAFITRAVIESDPRLGDVQAPGDPHLVAYFVASYQSMKLRFAFRFTDQVRFIDSVNNSPGLSRAERDDPFWIAQEAAARFGDEKSDKAYAETLLLQAWTGAEESYHVADVCVGAVRYARRIQGQGKLLARYADSALQLYPDDHVFLAASAAGHHMIAELGVRSADGDHAPNDSAANPQLALALDRIDQALTNLPPMGERTSYELFQQQYMAKREAIIDSMIHHDRIAARDRKVEQERQQRDERLQKQQEELESEIDQLERAMEKADDQNSANQVRSVELVAVFSAVIAFAVGAFQVANDGNLPMSDRAWLLVLWGALNVAFVLLVVGGTWIIAHSRDRRKKDKDPARDGADQRPSDLPDETDTH